MVALGSSLRVGDPEAQMSNLPGFLCSHSSWHSPQCAAHRHGGHALRAHRAADDSFLGPHARRPGFLRAVARAIADFASRSANIGKTKRRIMRTTLLLTALLCWSAHARSEERRVGNEKTPMECYTHPNANRTVSSNVLST